MLVSKTLRTVLVSAVAVMAVGTTPAIAATYLHEGTWTGSVLATGTAIDGSLKSGTNATLVTGSGTVMCTTATFAATVGGSGGATVTTTFASFALGSTPGTCSDTIPFLTVSSCALYQAKPGTATATSANGGTIAVEMIVRCDAGGGLFCYFRTNGTAGQAVGVYDNMANTLAFTSQSLALTTTDFAGAALPNQSGFCSASGTLTVTYQPVRVTSSGIIVVMNMTP